MTPPLDSTQTVILYSRVSTDDQADSGLGLDDQSAKLVGHAASKGWSNLVELVDEGESGKNLDRPAIAEALRMLEAGEAHALVVTKLDRLTRAVRDLGALMERAESEGWSLVILDLGIDTSTPAGRMVANVVGAIAQWEREEISARTRAALAAKKSRGERLGAPIRIDESVRRRIAREHEEGKSLGAIGRGLEADGIKTSTGKTVWQRGTVRHVLLSIEKDREAAALAEAAAS